MSPDASTRPPYVAAVVAGLAALCLYTLTLAPSTAFWDTSEYIATAHIVGIPHPPGNPFFVIVAHVWSLLLSPLGLSVAVRINLLAATTSAAATGFFYLVAHRVLSALTEHRGFARVGAGASALIGATAFTVWNQSTVNEKVYTISVLIIAAVSWLAVRWHDRKDQPGSERLLLWAVFLIAIGSTNHPMSLLPAPALALFVLVSRPSTFLRPRLLGRAALLVLLGLSFNFVLPVRAARNPVIDEGDPTCGSVLGAADAIYERLLPGPLKALTAPLPTCRPLADNLARVQYQTPPVTARKAPFSAQLAMYWQYFDWQWARGMDPSPVPASSRLPFTLLFLALGGVGLWTVWRADRAVFTYLLILVGTLSIGLVVYLNFKYGYSLSPEIPGQDLHEVRERDYFYVAGFLVWGCLAGIGLAWTWHTLAGVTKGTRRFLLASPVLLIAAFPIVLNWRWASRAGDYAAHDWAYDLLMSVEPYGVLFTNGDNDTFPLWYMQEVENVRRDVTVIVGQYLATTWYPRQLERLTRPENQRPFDAAASGGLYEDRAPPSSSITRLTGEQMDEMQAARLPEDMTVAFPELAVTYPKGSVLQRTQLLALRIIHDSIAQRPIYFSAQGGMLSELGLSPWGVRQGLVMKLEPRPKAQMAQGGLVQGNEAYGGIWFDLDRSLRLYRDVYRYRSIRDRSIWPDGAAVSIPLQYYAMALLLADVAQRTGQPVDLVDRLQSDARSFQLVADGGLDVASAP